MKIIFALTCLAMLAGCAMQGGNLLTATFDPDEITSDVVQRFKMADGDGVLRRTLNGVFQLKFYDRSAVIPMDEKNVWVENVSILADGSTVLLIHAPTPYCESHAYVMLVKKQGINMSLEKSDSIHGMETKGCQALEYSSQPNLGVWMLRPLQPNGQIPVIVVNEGKLYSIRDDRGVQQAKITRRGYPSSNKRSGHKHASGQNVGIVNRAPPQPSPIVARVEYVNFHIPPKADESRVDSKPVKFEVR